MPPVMTTAVTMTRFLFQWKLQDQQVYVYHELPKTFVTTVVQIIIPDFSLIRRCYTVNLLQFTSIQDKDDSWAQDDIIKYFFCEI